MKDVSSLAVFTAKVLCLVVFVNMLRPDRINPVQGPSPAQVCKTGRSAAQACDLSVNATMSRVVALQSSAARASP
jgi:hypothetical protein